MSSKFLLFYCSFLLLGALSGHAQHALFKNKEIMKLVAAGADNIYSMEADSALYYIEAVRDEIPDHPVVPMMEAVMVLWQNIPIIRDSVFNLFEQKLFLTISKSQEMVKNDPEAIFFEMAARGLLAEYYADKGNYLKAISEATKAYELLKNSFSMADEYPEFLFPVGIYNYFRVVYPEKYPVYKPLVWWFKSGDRVKGLQQIEIATRKSAISKIEASIYLSYIYLRYEENADSAKYFMEILIRNYPKNPYIQSKYIEALLMSNAYDKLSLKVIEHLIALDKSYYQFVGNVSKGVYYEKQMNDPKSAFEYYKLGLTIGMNYPENGGYYKSLGYLGAGRSMDLLDKSEAAKKYYELALQYAETSEIKNEAKMRLGK
jgi:tetratricopeptide (TPR) repeat protein